MGFAMMHDGKARCPRAYNYLTAKLNIYLNEKYKATGDVAEVGEFSQFYPL